MKNKVIILILSLTLIFSGMYTLCNGKISCNETHRNGVPAYFLEPEGYVIASVRSVNATLTYNGKYGYILEEDYQAYLNGKVDGILVVKHPYEEGKETTIAYKEIECITIGEYKDLR